MLRVIIPFLLLLLSALQAAAAPGRADGPALPVTVDAADPARLVVSVGAPTVVLEQAVEGGEVVTVVTVAGGMPNLVAGEPDLPTVPIHVVLPAQGRVEATILAERWREVPLAAPPRPSRGNLPRTGPPAGPLAFGSAYGGGVHPADAVAVGRPYLAGGVRGLGLQVHAARWDADRGMLLVLESLVIAIGAGGAGGVNELAVDASGGAPARPIALAALDGARYANPPNVDGAAKYRPTPTGGRLMVVTPAAFVAAAGDFLQWKRERGFAPLLLTVEQAGGTAAAIRDSVAARYAEPGGLGYLLLLGDVPQVPAFAGLFEGADDDTRYAQVAGDDLYPDLFVSRVSAADPTALARQLDRFIAYERDPEPGGAWYGRAVGAASNEGVPTDAQRADALRDTLLAGPFTAVDRLYQPDATAAMISGVLAEGRSLLNYLGHGSGTSWSNPPFTVADVHGLANGRRLPWIIDVSCANGRFSDSECFAEAWLRAGTGEEPAGAIAMYSASTTTPWVPPTVMQEEVVSLLASGRADEIGALCQGGIMKVLDAYPGDEGRQLVEQYNIFGDCTLQVRTAPPAPVALQLAGSLAAGVDVLPVTTDAPGARVAVTGPGLLYGAADADAEGRAVVPLAVLPAAGTEVLVTVTGRDLLPRRETIPVTVPVSVAVTSEPATLAAGVEGTLTAALSAPEAGLEAVVVALEGWGVEDLEERVPADGAAVFAGIRPRYGETLRLSGRDAADGRLVFQAPVAVEAASELVEPWVAAGVEAFGMDGVLAPGVAGRISGGAAGTGLQMRLVGCGLDTAVTTAGGSVAVEAAPAEAGALTVALLRDGCGAWTRTIPVVAAVGTADGLVLDQGEPTLPVGGARVTLWRSLSGQDEPVFSTITDAHGRWRRDPDLAAGPVLLTVERYGYTTAREERVVLFGANSWQTDLQPAPRAPVAGTVTAAGTGLPIAARVEIRRADDLVVVAAATADAAGAFATIGLPVGAYLLESTAAGFVPVQQEVTIAVDGGPVAVAMRPVAGSLVVVDAGLPPGVPFTFPARLDKHGRETAPAYTTVPAMSGLDIVAALSAQGYACTYQPLALLDPASWAGADVVVLARGDHPLALPEALRDAASAHVAAGGRLLAEGGDLAAVQRLDHAWLHETMGLACWAGDRTDTVTAAAGDHPVVMGPSTAAGIMALAARGAADGDALQPAASARVLARWADGSAAAVGMAADPGQRTGRTVAFGFTWSRLPVGTRERLLQNAVEWLLATVPADAALAGRAVDGDGVAAAAVDVWLEPGGHERVTDAAGAFSFGDLVPGRYLIGAGGGAFAGVVREVEVAPGGVTAVPPLVLPAAADTVVCGDGGPVPDDAPGGFVGEIAVASRGTVGSVRIEVDLDHPWVGDLRCELVSPAGTTLVLKHADGWPGDAGLRVFMGDLAFGDDLRRLVGEPATGTWRLRVADLAAEDAGAVRSWCLGLVTAAAPPPDPGDGPPSALAIVGNRPNPFNPDTLIRYAVPQPGRVRLSVHDLRGRLVRVLVDGHRTAAVHEVGWDGRDDHGRSVGSGAYLLRIEGADAASSAKVMLLR